MTGRETGNPGVRLCAQVGRGDFCLDVDLEFRAGEVTAILGPNGAGKTTLLRAVAGLQPIDSGVVRIGDRVVDDGARVLIAPAGRQVGLVFQDYALFPHLTVLENVAFGPRSRGVPAGIARSTANDLLARLGIADLAPRRPSAISGGQAQRVALARALATSPDVLLLDEPMAALDAEARVSVRDELRTVLTDFSGVTIMVSHEVEDARFLAHRAVVLEGGRVTQDAAPDVLAHQPATSYVAALMRTSSR
jgi:molybdate transport system ATP-binding protein